jgi:preprotein translocase subunit SecF
MSQNNNADGQTGSNGATESNGAAEDKKPSANANPSGHKSRPHHQAEHKKNDNQNGNQHAHQHSNQHGDKRNFFLKIYDVHYKHLLIISILLLVFSVGTISYKIFTTGDFVSKGISLNGGLTLTVETQEKFDTEEIQRHLRAEFPKSDINVLAFTIGTIHGFTVDASEASEEELVNALQSKYPALSAASYSSELVGSSLGKSFFVQTLKAVFIAFLFMSLVVFIYFGDSSKLKWIAATVSIAAALIMFYSNTIFWHVLSLLMYAALMVMYFRTNMPSFGIMLCAISDVLFSLAIFNIMDMKLNTAGVAAFLMLIGYSIDTDILLSVRVLKRREGTVLDRTLGAMKTGMMMSFAALVAVLSAYLFTESAVIKEIMFILIIGLVGDIIFTWIQNAGILRWHLEKKGWK